MNINDRLNRHNKGLVNSTKIGTPWTVKATFQVPNKSEAVILEKKIKKRGAKRFLLDNHFGV